MQGTQKYFCSSSVFGDKYFLDVFLMNFTLIRLFESISFDVVFHCFGIRGRSAFCTTLIFEGHGLLIPPQLTQSHHTNAFV